MKYGKLSKLSSEERVKEDKYFKDLFLDLELGWEGEKVRVALVDVKDEGYFLFYKELLSKYLDNTCVVKKIESGDLSESNLLRGIYRSFIGKQFFDLVYIKASWLTLTLEKKLDLLIKNYRTLEKGGIIVYQSNDSKEDLSTELIKEYFKNKNVSINFLETGNKKNLVIRKSNSLSLKNFILVSMAIYPVWFLWYIFGLDKLHILINNQTIDILATIFIFSIINWIFGNKRIGWIISLLLNIVCFSLWVNKWTDDYSTTIMAFSEVLIIYPITFLIVTFAQFMTWIPFLIKFSYQNRKNLHNIRWE